MTGRIRTIKPEWLEDEKLLCASGNARTLSVALLVLADDAGRGRMGRSVAARVFPSDPSLFDAALAELRPWYVGLYEVRGQQYFRIRNWLKHQRIDRPSKPLTPEPAEGTFLDVDRPAGAEPDGVIQVARDTLARLAECHARVVGQTYGALEPPRATYFIQAVSGGPVKIGMARDPAARLVSIQAGNSELLRVVAVSSVPENEVHRLFAADRLAGEWFRYSRALDEYATRARWNLATDRDHDQDHYNDPDLLLPAVKETSHAR
jgi:hypothetical protein